MIVYDLKCKKGHVFEAWFPSSAAYDRQAAADEVVCPICGSRKVSKAPMAPNLAPSVGKARAGAADQAAEAMRELRQLRENVEKNCDYVGDRFAEEARKIHYREADPRNIYGETTTEQAKELKEEGVEFGVIPWVPRHDA